MKPTHSMYPKLSLLALASLLVLPLPARAGTEPVNAVAPPDAGAAPAPLDVGGETFDGNSTVQPFVFDNVQRAVGEVVGEDAAAPQALSDQPIPDAAISLSEIGASTLATPIGIATDVADSVVAGNPVTVTIAAGRIQVTPGQTSTTVAMVKPATTRTQQFIGAPSTVNQQVGTVVALTAAGATEKATQSGSAIAAVGVQAAGIVELILGFQSLAGDFTSASLPATDALPVLLASRELSPGLIASRQQINLRQLNQVIASYNQVITNCPPNLLPQLSENAEFRTIGEALRQLRDGVQ